jgi:hypothetical protein
VRPGFGLAELKLPGRDLAVELVLQLHRPYVINCLNANDTNPARKACIEALPDEPKCGP